MTTTTTELEVKGRAARAAARRLSMLATEVKDRALAAVAEALLASEAEILAANAEDLEEGRRSGIPETLLDRLMLNGERLQGYANDVLNVMRLPDPVGEVFDGRTLPNGMVAQRQRVPLGVIGVIFESRPNVTVEIASLCLKSGNACLLRGGKEAIRSNVAVARVIARAAEGAGVPEGAVQLVESTDRALVTEMLQMRDVIDLMVPRGGMDLINVVREGATMPVLIGGRGVCHTYVDRAADLDKAVAIAYNAKVRRPSICNALDTLIVHRDVAVAYLPRIAAEWAKKNVEIRCDPASLEILGDRGVAATSDDYGKEFLDYIASVKVVDGVNEALDHIERHGTGHSDAIVTEDYGAAMRFVREVDSAVVYVNASTQFTDGAQFGLGAEIIDSTQKTIARGPVGLREITTYKWVVLGDGHVRP